MRRYRDQFPVWMTARFASACACGHSIRRGEKILYHASSRKAQCQACGEAYEARLAADDFDQAVYDGWKGGY